jgi:hypothetical protein
VGQGQPRVGRRRPAQGASTTLLGVLPAMVVSTIVVVPPQQV